VLKISIENTSGKFYEKQPSQSKDYLCSFYELDYHDLLNIFIKFGELNKIILTGDKKVAFIFFNSFTNAYIAFKLLQNLTLRGETLKFFLEWTKNSDFQGEIAAQLQSYINTINW
jgi:hypothetical protein